MENNTTLSSTFLVCMDSDGCAIDSMTVKHLKAFGPAFAEVWNVGEEMKDTVLEEWNRINLYTLTRGINRFQGLVAILKMYPELDDESEINRLAAWTETTKALSPTVLEEEYKKTELQIMKKALVWSKLVNQIIESLALAEPFDGVKHAMEIIKEHAHIAVVSSANPAAIEEEWKTSGLYDMVDYFYSQADGTKAECISMLKKKGYEKQNIIMIGDAIGDQKAAVYNDVWFYPILVSRETYSWKVFVDEYFDKFLKGNINEINQAYWINAMKENLA